MKFADITLCLPITALLLLSQGCTVSFPQVEALWEMTSDRQGRNQLNVQAFQWRVTYDDYATTMLAVQDGAGGVRFKSEFDEVTFDGRYITSASELGQFETQWQVRVGQEGLHSLYKNGSFTASLQCGEWEKREGQFLFDATQREPLTTLYTQVCTRSSGGKQFVNAVGLTAVGTTSYIHQYFNESLTPLTLVRSALLSE